MNAPFRSLVVSAALALGGDALAQTATISGSIGNFDVINHLQQEAHGFEIELDGLQPADVVYTFSYQRYGQARILPSATGAVVRWESAYDAGLGQFTAATLPHTPGAPFAGTCYMGGAGYDTSGCEHFGASLRANAARTTYRWLVATPAAPGTLVPVDPPLAIAAPSYTVQPPAQAGGEPVLVAEVQAPEPAEAPELYGDAQWMKVFVTQLPREASLDELLTGSPAVPQDPSQVEVSWDIVQAEPASTSNGNQRRSRKRNQGGIDITTRAVVRRYELYTYTGAYDPVTHEALCADLTCSAPSTGELGEFLSAQMTAANVQDDAISVARSGNGSVDSSDKRISCGNVCGAFYEAGTLVTLTAKPASGTVLSGWTGACTGTATTCAVNATGHVDVGATFTTLYTLSIGRSNKGTVTSAPAGIDCGGSCSAKFGQGTSVTLTAIPPAGVPFLGWSGGCTGTASSCTLTISKDTSVQASFGK